MNTDMKEQEHEEDISDEEGEEVNKQMQRTADQWRERIARMDTGESIVINPLIKDLLRMYPGREESVNKAYTITKGYRMVDSKFANLIADRIQKAGGQSDWYTALYSAALDEHKDPMKALEVADEAFANNPTQPMDVESDLTEEDATGIMGYKPYTGVLPEENSRGLESKLGNQAKALTTQDLISKLQQQAISLEFAGPKVTLENGVLCLRGRHDDWKGGPANTNKLFGYIGLPKEGLKRLSENLRKLAEQY